MASINIGVIGYGYWGPNIVRNFFLSDCMVKAIADSRIERLGVAGLIKGVLSLHHRTLVPSINFEKPNPKIDFNSTPFYVVRELKQWESDAPLRAAISSFGVGGTNAHVVLEEAPATITENDNKRPVLLLLSGHTPVAAEQNRKSLVNFLQTNNVSLRDAASAGNDAGLIQHAFR